MKGATKKPKKFYNLPKKKKETVRVVFRIPKNYWNNGISVYDITVIWNVLIKWFAWNILEIWQKWVNERKLYLYISDNVI